MQSKTNFYEKYVINSETIKSKNNQYVETIIQKYYIQVGSQMKANYISVFFDQEKINQKYNNFQQLLQLKVLNILQPNDIYLENQQYILVYENNFNKQLTKLKNVNLNSILLQLTLFFAEIQRRGLILPINPSTDNMYLIDGILYFSLVDMDIELLTPSKSVYQLYKEFIQQLQPNCPIIQTENSFSKILLDSFLQNAGNFHITNALDPPYEEVVAFLLNNKNLERIYYGNSIINKFTSETLQTVFHQFQTDFICKQTITDKFNNSEQIQINVNREIELQERISGSDYLVGLVTYLKIDKQSFIIQRYYPCTLAQVLQKYHQNQQQYNQIDKQKYLIFIAQRFAKSLQNLHQLKILHRDLKPENLLIDTNIDAFINGLGHIFIADFDRSKFFRIESLQETKINQYNTRRYDPPEQEHTLKSDIWQFGMIMLVIANNGNYIGNDYLGVRGLNNNEYQYMYSHEAIKATLGQINEKLINIISQCLNIDQNARPTAEELYNQINSVHIHLKIKLIHKFNQTQMSSQQSQQHQTTLDQSLEETQYIYYQKKQQLDNCYAINY